MFRRDGVWHGFQTSQPVQATPDRSHASEIGAAEGPHSTRPPTDDRSSGTLRYYFRGMTRGEKRLAVRSVVLGVLLTLLVMAADFAGAFEPLEEWLYDKRVQLCQFFV